MAFCRRANEDYVTRTRFGRMGSARAELSRRRRLPLRRSPRRGRSGRRLGFEIRVDPAGVHTGAEAFLHLRIDAALPDDTAKGRLQMRARTAKPIVQSEVPIRRVEIVPPKQIDRTASEPNAFRLRCRTAEHAGGFGKLIGLLGGFFRSFSLRRSLLVAAPGVAALGGNRGGHRDESGHAEEGRNTRTRNTQHGGSLAFMD